MDRDAGSCKSAGYVLSLCVLSLVTLTALPASYTSAWQPFTLQGTYVQDSQVWPAGQGTYTNRSSPSTDYFWVGDVCYWTGTVWKCGCRDSTSSTNYWQLQGVTRGSGGGGGGSSGTPQFTFKSYIGESAFESARDVAYDSSGNRYTVGGTQSSNFPTPGAVYDKTHDGSMDVFVTKHSPSGSLVWSTLIGSPNYDRAYAIEVDDTGVYVAGRAGSGFPTTAGVVQTSFGGDSNPNSAYGTQDGFIVKFDHDGQRVWSTYIGGGDRSFVRDIAVDSSGLYVVMPNVSVGSPHITAGTFQTSIRKGDDGFIAKLSKDGTQVYWGTYLGGSGHDLLPPTLRVVGGHPVVFGLVTSSNMPLRNAHDATLSGESDGYLAKLTPDGKDLVFATYVGGNGAEDTETHQLAIDQSGNIFTGFTTLSTDLPANGYDTTFNSASAVRDAYIAKYSPDGAFLAATYYGGSQQDDGEGIAIDGQGRVGLAGNSESNNLPMVGAIQSTYGGNRDSYLAVFSNDLKRLIFSTYIGGSQSDAGRELATKGSGVFLTGGDTSSPDFGNIGGGQSSYGGGQDAWVAEIIIP